MSSPGRRQRLWLVGIIALLVSAAWFGLTPKAWAHGNVPIEEDACARFLGRQIIHFSAYQPQHEKGAQYCNEIPNTGDTIVVVDLYNQRLREVPVSLKIIDPNAPEENQVLFASKPKIYKHGVIEASAPFDHSGLYRAVVTIFDGGEQSGSLDFRVEPDKTLAYVSSALMYAIFLGLLGLLIGTPIWRMIQRKREST